MMGGWPPPETSLEVGGSQIKKEGGKFMGEEFHTINLKELGKESPDAGLVPDVIKIPSKGFSGYSMESWSRDQGRRVFHEGGWYLFKGTEDGMDILDKIPAAVLKAEQEADEVEEAKRLAEKGHDCWENVAHDLYERDNGTKNDYYYCTICDDVLQTG
jgi:hypothetical protein